MGVEGGRQSISASAKPRTGRYPVAGEEKGRGVWRSFIQKTTSFFSYFCLLGTGRRTAVRALVGIYVDPRFTLVQGK